MTKNIVFIDSRVSGYETLIASLSADSEWYLLDATQDGLDQMQRVLEGRTGLDSIHIVSHGSAGTLYLGSTMLNSDNLANYQNQLQAIGSRLTETGDLLLYGCNVAAGDYGIQFIHTLVSMTRADVAASNDISGPTVLNGDGELEVQAGMIESTGLSLDSIPTKLAANTAPTFMVGDGMVTTAIGKSASNAYSIALQSNGKIVVAGYADIDGTTSGNTDFAVVRYNADGSLDASFSDDGMVITQVGTGIDKGYSVAVQPDGKILVAGSAFYEGRENFGLVRYNTDGSLDTSFSEDGMVGSYSYHWSGGGLSVALQPDGKILLAGYGSVPFALRRYNVDGSLDTSFPGDFYIPSFTHFSEGGASAKSVTVQLDGKILVAGDSSGFAVARYNADGSLDTSFSDDGKLTTTFGYGYHAANSIIVQPDGKILVAGHAYNGINYDFAVVRYNADGSLDTSFDGDGTLTMPIGPGDDYGYSVAVQPDGKIVVAGHGSGYFAIVRYNADGSLDNYFSDDGMATGTVIGYGRSVVLQPDGKIVVAGYDSDRFVLARYNSDGSLDPTFDGVNTLDGVAYFRENDSPVILDGNVHVYDAELYISGNYSGVSITLSRHGGASAEDQFSITGDFSPLTENSSLVSGGSSAIGVVTQNSNGTLIITFNVNATQTLIDSVLSSLSYQNVSDNPPSSVQIDWILSDGNRGSQGTGGALSTNGSTVVNITAVNDVPTGTDKQISAHPNSIYTLSVADFGFLDPEDGVTMPAVRIDTLPTQGKMYYMGAWLTRTGMTFTSADLSSGYLTYHSDTSEGSFTFSVKDSGGLYDASPNTFTCQINSLPTGTLTISGTATQGQVLSAANSLADVDGLGTISYQWKANGTTISGAISSTYALTQAEVGKAITVTASYTDQQGMAESMTSAATAAVANVNDTPTGTVTISGTATQGQTLTASNSLADVDGLGTISYQWQANGADITGATNSTYTLTQAEVAKTVTVTASYTDGQGTAESKTSVATAAVTNVNDAPAGTVTISGTATQGQTLTAGNSLADVDGLGTISYQWKADGTAISGATGSSYTLSQSEVGKTVTVTASYTDGQGTAESKTSAATAAVANVNDAPTGTVTISGTATQGQTLTAANTLADVDGIPTSGAGVISYQWKADRVDISGATGNSYTLKQAEVGKTITVTASYTDGQGAAESKTSAATAAVANVNDAPTGTVTISGTVTQGQTLTATNTLADADGLGLISYQWQANGSPISGATNSTYTLTQAELGKAITVLASYTDGQGMAESKASSPTAAVTQAINVITGSSASETLAGSVAADSIDAGSGNDLIRGLGGSDSLRGGDGTDTAVYAGTADQYTLRIDRAARTATVTDSQPERDGTDELTGVERVQLGNQTFDLFNLPRTEVPRHSVSRTFLFDAAYYLLSNPELVPTVSLQTAAQHYLSTGAAAGLQPNMWFDPDYYASRWADLAPLDLTPDILFLHYNLYGVWEGRSAGPMFDRYDGNRYLTENPDVAAYVDAHVADFLGSRTNGAIAHYVIYGADEGRVAYDLDGKQLEAAVLVGVTTG